MFEKHNISMTLDEAVELFGKIARQMQTNENGEIAEKDLDQVAGGIAWASVGLGVLCVGGVALGIYNSYQEAKRKN